MTELGSGGGSGGLMLARVRLAIGTTYLAAAIGCALFGCSSSSSAPNRLDAGGEMDHPALDVAAPGSGSDGPTNMVRACSNDNACGGLQPKCDLVTSRCASCNSAGADCVGGSICDATTGSCVECLADADCAAPTPSCDSKRHVCVATCRTARDCGTTGGVCDTVRSSCVECTADAQCRGGMRCDLGTATCVECLVDAHCPIDSPVCTSGHICSDACATDADCGGGTPGGGGFCDPSSHLCTDCLRNADCGVDSYCRANGTCA